MSKLCLILGDQLSHNLSSLQSVNKEQDTILIVEVWEEATYVKHHKKKIAFLFSAMRHFAEELRENGYSVRYTRLNDDNNTGSFEGEVKRAIDDLSPDKVIVTHPGEYRVLENIKQWSDKFDVDVDILEDDRFITTPDYFKSWATDGRKTLTMEYFYREVRKKTGLLMNEDNQPVGGEWNYDKENRKPPKDDLSPTPPRKHEPDEITQEVLELVADRFSDHFGDLEPFFYAVTSNDAKAACTKFMKENLPLYGTYQDAMVEGEPFMFHSIISMYLNCGLLDPMEVCRQAEECYYDSHAPINAVEGFIRQIIGWREYVRGLYWLKMPEYKEMNHLNATRDLPDFYWTAETDMNCMKQCISQTKEHAYAHHIQRLMVLGNFALVAGLHPDWINEWYLIVYADAYEWVELPNVTGMVLYADGGILGSKPYAASGKYINKMSDYCKDCKYSVSKSYGDDACPFNYLYWDFLIRNEDQLRGNHRMGLIYSSLDRMDTQKIQKMQESAKAFLEEI